MSRYDRWNPPRSEADRKDIVQALRRAAWFIEQGTFEFGKFEFEFYNRDGARNEPNFLRASIVFDARVEKGAE